MDQAHKLITHQLDKIVGMAMLIAATTIFTYYTIWTLLMVCAFRLYEFYVCLHYPSALCRRGPPSAESLPSSRLGHPHPRHSHSTGLNCGGLILGHGHDQKQQEEGGKGASGCGEEVEIGQETGASIGRVNQIHDVARRPVHVVDSVQVHLRRTGTESSPPPTFYVACHMHYLSVAYPGAYSSRHGCLWLQHRR